MNWERVLNRLAQAGLFVTSPPQVLELLNAIGRAMGHYGSEADLKRAVRRLEGRGTCLSRTLALAARMPGSEVVIGMDPATHHAHAWLEVRGLAMEPAGLWRELGRLKGATDR